MKIEGLEALARPGYDAEGRRRTWNHRVVRRYVDAPIWDSWLEVTEVHYRDGKPDFYADSLGPPCAFDGEDDAAKIAGLRAALQRMMDALDQPILDEKTDFAPDAEEGDA